jgi:hypothetical protein
MRFARVEPDARDDPAAFVCLRCDGDLFVRVRAADALREPLFVIFFGILPWCPPLQPGKRSNKPLALGSVPTITPTFGRDRARCR